MKRIIVFLFLIGFLTLPIPAEAFTIPTPPPLPSIPCPKFTPFVCTSNIQKLISDTLTPIQNTINSLISQVTNLQNTDTDQNNRISTLENDNASDSATITDLQAKIQKLESNQPPTPADNVFFNNVGIPLQGSVTSQVFDAKGYSKIVFTYQCYQQGAQLLLLVSDDKTNFATAYTVSADQCHTGGSVTLDIAGRYYETYIGNDSNVINPSPSVYAIGHFE